MNSILAQTYEDFVVVVVNDAGDAATVDDVVAEVSDRAYGRIQVVHNAISAGREAAMNTGVEATSSTYLVIHDDDDTWAPTFLEATVAALASSDDIGVATRTQVVFERVVGDTVMRDREEILASNRHEISLLEILHRNYAPPISILYRRILHDEIGPYDGSLDVLADWDFLLRALSRHTIGFIDGEPLAHWHQRPDSTGDLSNSVVADDDAHRAVEVRIRERYLRAALADGTHLGPLLVQAAEADRRAEGDRRRVGLSPVSGMVAHEADQLAARLDDLAGHLRDLNQNLVTQNNRFVARFDLLEGRVQDLRTIAIGLTPRGRVSNWRRALRHGLSRLR